MADLSVELDKYFDNEGHSDPLVGHPTPDIDHPPAEPKLEKDGQARMFGGDDEEEELDPTEKSFEVLLTLKLKVAEKGAQSITLPILPFPIKTPGRAVLELLQNALNSETFRAALEGIAGEQDEKKQAEVH